MILLNSGVARGRDGGPPDLAPRLQLRACFRNLFRLGHTGRNAICSCSGEFALLALAVTIHEHALYRLIHRGHVPLERTALAR